MTLETRNQKPETRPSRIRHPASGVRGYTLIELIVAVGLFALIMTLAAGAYLVMIGVARQTQAVSIGINNLAFALETMTRTIRTGTNYACGTGSWPSDCPSGGTSFSVRSSAGVGTSYTRWGDPGVIYQNGIPLTDPSVDVTSLTFYAYNTAKPTGDNYRQPRVIILVSGTVSSGPGKTIPFSVETQATMRGSDI